MSMYSRDHPFGSLGFWQSAYKSKKKNMYNNKRFYDYSKTRLKRIFVTVMCLVTWPLNKSEVGVDLVMIQTSLLFLC